MVNDNLERASAEDLLNHQFTKIYEDEEGKVVFFSSEYQRNCGLDLQSIDWSFILVQLSNIASIYIDFWNRSA